MPAALCAEGDDMTENMDLRAPDDWRFWMERAEKAEQERDMARRAMSDALDLVDAAEARIKEAEAVIARLVEVFTGMEDGNGNPCPDVATAAKFLEDMP
jgi:hypothetical protein